MSLFDRMGKVAFKTTTSVMGYPAAWHMKDGVTVLTAKVHFKDPASIVKIGDRDYDPSDGIMEYKKGDFEGLKQLADKNEAELIKITIENTVYEFNTVKDKKLFDGQTIQVKLMKI
jgi:hypothetical protein